MDVSENTKLRRSLILNNYIKKIEEGASQEKKRKCRFTTNDKSILRRKNLFGLASSLFANVHETIDIQPKSGLCFIFDSFTIFDEIH
jgi:hypothetical protein